MTESTSLDQTRNRLLLAAVEIFAERGFREATVREICAKADVNIASINYHFRNKAALYKEALAFAFMQADQRYPLNAAKDGQLSAEIRLKNFIRIFLHKLTDDTHLGHHGKLIAREIADPTEALDEIITLAMAPQFEILSNAVLELLEEKTSRIVIHRCVLSILGQCLMYKHSRSVIDRICPEVIGNADEINKTAEHIARFSLAALKQLSAAPLEH